VAGDVGVSGVLLWSLVGGGVVETSVLLVGMGVDETGVEDGLVVGSSTDVEDCLDVGEVIVAGLLVGLLAAGELGDDPGRLVARDVRSLNNCRGASSSRFCTPNKLACVRASRTVKMASSRTLNLDNIVVCVCGGCCCCC